MSMKLLHSAGYTAISCSCSLRSIHQRPYTCNFLLLLRGHQDKKWRKAGKAAGEGETDPGGKRRPSDQRAEVARRLVAHLATTHFSKFSNSIFCSPRSKKFLNCFPTLNWGNGTRMTQKMSRAFPGGGGSTLVWEGAHNV